MKQRNLCDLTFQSSSKSGQQCNQHLQRCKQTQNLSLPDEFKNSIYANTQESSTFNAMIDYSVYQIFVI